MPIKSNPKDEENARILAKAIGLKFTKVDLNESYDALIGTFEKILWKWLHQILSQDLE